MKQNKVPHTGKPVQTSTAKMGNKEKRQQSSWLIAASPYVLGFFLLWIFSSFIYGDVFVRAEQDSFFAFEALQMKHLTDQSFGYIYWAMRGLLLSFKSAWFGGFVLSFFLTAAAWFINRAFRTPQRLHGLAFLLPLLILAFFVYRGLNIWHKQEPGIIFLLPVALFLLTGFFAAVMAIVRRLRKPVATESVQVKTPGVFTMGNIVLVLAFAALTTCTLWFNQNEILTSRMQLRAEKSDWEGMIEDALSARRPTRAVAAYYAIALTQTDRLLEHIFDLPFDYPKARLDEIEANPEYALFVPEANLHAGLTNPAYHAAMELITINGPRLHNLKIMAISALLNGEKELTRKLLGVIGSTPFEDAFVEKYAAMIDDPKLIEADPTLQNIRRLAPMEDKFEQNFRSPAFLGYNMGLLSGTDYTLLTSVASCLYTKDLDNLLTRARILKTKRHLPTCVQEAIVIAALKRDGLLKQFPGINPFVEDKLRSFFRDAKPYSKDKKALRKEMKEKWLGTYIYYYYCENNEPHQVKQSTKDAAVN